VADWLHDNPWRQGHVLNPESAEALGLAHPDASTDTIAVVVSHDCDLAGDVEVEPHCEIIVGRKIPKSNGGLTNAKSVRRLHVTCSYGETVLLIELEVQNRQLVKKVDLADHEPSTEIQLTTHERTLLQAWLAARYNRPSFPDEFVRRLTAARATYRKIEKQLSETSSHILMMLFDLDEGKPDSERQGESDCYSLSIYIVFSVDVDPAESQRVAAQTAAEIEKLFTEEFKKDGRWLNIELVSCEPASEEEITLRVARLTRRWYMDHVSLRGGHPLVNL
jgi:hypothetical protein